MGENSAQIKDNITGILLAGGMARRMGGDDKGMLAASGKPLVEWTFARLAPQVKTTLINANRNADFYARYGRVVADQVGGFCGPLAGIHAGMDAAATTWILSAPCDSPFMPSCLAAELFAAAERENADLAVAAADHRPQPVFMLAKTALKKNLAAFLSGGGRKIDLWYAPLAHAVVNFADADSFANINTPEELRAAESLLAKTAAG